MHFEKLRENNIVQTLLLGPNYVPINWKHFPQKKYYREKNFREILLSIKALVVHSKRVRDHLAKKSNMLFAAPPMNLCTDNGAMIAWAGIENYNIGNIVREPVARRPRWPLIEL